MCAIACGGTAGETTGGDTTGGTTGPGATTQEPTTAGPAETTTTGGEATTTLTPGTTDAPTVTGEPETTTSSGSTTEDATTEAPLTCPAGAFCDDFEAYAAGSPPDGAWTAEGGGQISVVEDKAVSGTRSVKLDTTPGYGGRAILRLTGQTLLPTPHMFGRLRMWLTEASPDGVHWTMIEASGPGAQAPGVFGGLPFDASFRYGGQHDKRMMANYETPGYYSQNGPGSDCWNHSQTTIPEQVWSCMEWEFDAEAWTIRFWLDGQPIDDLTVGTYGQGCVHDGTLEQWVYPQLFEQLMIGWIDYQEGGNRELWIDDFAVGPARIGCD